jgi:GAF domain-containing protein
LTACVPLEVDGRGVGTLALFRLLEHKAQLEAPDIELLDLLKVHVGVALVATRPGPAA